MNDDITAHEIAQENTERLGELFEMLREVREKGLIYWEPNTSRGADNLRDMLAGIDRFMAAAVHDAEKAIQRTTELLRDARDKGLIYWEPNTDRGAERKADMVARIDALIDPAPAPGPRM